MALDDCFILVGCCQDSYKPDADDGLDHCRDVCLLRNCRFERERVVAWRAICRLVAILAAASGRQRAIFLPTPQHTRKITLS
jgi:hypothetical protein